MRNILIVSLRGPTLAYDQEFGRILPTLQTRATLHESLDLQDALNYINSGWPTHILLPDGTITQESPIGERLLVAVRDYTKQGCTTIAMATFPTTVSFNGLEDMFLSFGLLWQVEEYSTRYIAFNRHVDASYLRQLVLNKNRFVAGVLSLNNVARRDTVYYTLQKEKGKHFAYAAMGRVGLGKLGYIGDTGFGEEPEHLLIAMCHLDRP